ncbi:GAF domain-containing sensor histidine kinase [Neolewinella lacunae]|uniref:histidine kinase n=1 Tax=Neolewinella lacunae TaxID=1517758 RepID=A0A923PPF3_9BACT|nr:GAF domain-containing sensor histidine kinase [Neolewinella lacunae]MBC6994282.1 GAF domain-containing sensor histidine kinase [Neolewinella lacunae]MDN3635340.1 GAF domain-containing sensor histidine kinase [Neolewinella lacunae]
MIAPLPPNEAERLAKLRSYNILDSLTEEEYDDLTYVASAVCGAPVSMISFIDQERQWYKSTRGIDPNLRQTPREIAFCAHTILDPTQPTVVEDMRKDPRFADNPFVAEDPHAVFYAGVPIVSDDGFALGTICVIDLQPRTLSEEQVEVLRKLSRQAWKLIELRQTAQQSKELLKQRVTAYRELTDFSYIIAHDLKAPLRNIMQACTLLEEDLGDKLGEDEKKLLEIITSRAYDARNLVNGVLRYSRATRGLLDSVGEVDLPELVAHAGEQVGLSEGVTLCYVGEVEKIRTSRIALLQILQNLIGNAVKFRRPEAPCAVTVDCRRTDLAYHFTVADQGVGIPEKLLKSVFDLFYTTGNTREGEHHGVGLTIVQRLVSELGGEVKVSSVVGEGTTFSFTLRDAE